MHKIASTFIFQKEPAFEVIRNATNILDSNNHEPSKLLLVVIVPENIKKAFNSLSKKTKIELLNDKKFDWVVNLLLYEEYDREAYLYFTSIKKKQNWLPIRNEEISYWTHLLIK